MTKVELAQQILDTQWRCECHREKPADLEAELDGTTCCFNCSDAAHTLALAGIELAALVKAEGETVRWLAGKGTPAIAAGDWNWKSLADATEDK